MSTGTFGYPYYTKNSPRTDAESKKRMLEAALMVDERSIRHIVDEERVPIETTNFVGQTAAHIAAMNRNLPILRYLLFRQPALVFTTDRWGQTPLHLAVERGAIDMVDFLIEAYYADPAQRCGHRTGNNALHIAAESGQLATLKYLIERRQMDPNEKNDEGQSAVLLAARVDHLHIIEYLAENTAANLTTVDNDGRNLLFMSAKVLYGSLRVPKYVLDQKKIAIDVNYRDNRGLTVTHYACKFFHFPTIKYYVEVKQADVNIADNRDRTPLHLASKLHNLRLVEYLVYHGADPKRKDAKGKTALDLATDSSVVDFLKETLAKRSRRSVAGSFFESMPFWTPQMIPRVLAGEKSVVRRSAQVGEVAGKLTPANDFLFLANAFFGRAKRGVVSPRQEVLNSRVDSVAVDAVHSDAFN